MECLVVEYGGLEVDGMEDFDLHQGKILPFFTF